MSLQGKNAIVTGGSRGIGKGIVLELASRGANVLLTYQSSRSQADEVVERARQSGVDAFAVVASGGDLSAPTTVVDAAVARWGQVDIIVNNAGTREDYDFEAMTSDAWERQFNANVRFPTFLIQAATRHFGPAPRIVNFSSSYAHDGHAGCLAYVGCKGAIESLTRSLARELGHKYNATVNCVCPGPVATELWQQSLQDPETAKEWDSIIKTTPAAPRVAEVDDIAQIVGFLSEERSRWITGMVVNANGGLMFN
ncbi:putative gluconate 5-dehydrogenase [Aspergillus steynii IBT 23096]|uniref:Putative gluconate 5-dehydrogenase n=1 Tax=Aspergillus steynii IBT 23096 TaxID=1392250 RepID=A0A2I2G3F2_9EURO|nr:putative gluconate 5-dehydrogenase [Aspergillus steynii IBT 23096]PLB47408.1 putative gluconate 5-dehydrogenase [Aspergillus steynii IBT 23096]